VSGNIGAWQGTGSETTRACSAQPQQSGLACRSLINGKHSRHGRPREAFEPKDEAPRVCIGPLGERFPVQMTRMSALARAMCQFPGHPVPIGTIALLSHNCNYLVVAHHPGWQMF